MVQSPFLSTKETRAPVALMVKLPVLETTMAQLSHVVHQTLYIQPQIRPTLVLFLPPHTWYTVVIPPGPGGLALGPVIGISITGVHSSTAHLPPGIGRMALSSHRQTGIHTQVSLASSSRV